MKLDKYRKNPEAVMEISRLEYSTGGKLLLDSIREERDTAMNRAMIEAGKGQNLRALRLLNRANSFSDILDFVEQSKNAINKEDA